MKTYLKPILGLILLSCSSAAFADCVLRQSTASQEVVLPTFVDSTDGDTAETALTIANTDVKLTKGGGTSQVNKNSGGATHMATGDYYIVLDATDTDTVGNLHIKVKVAGALAVWKECVVVEEAVYDADYAASATGMRLANVTQWTSSDLLTGTGPLPGLGVLDRGNLQSDSTTALQLRAAATFADDELIGATGLLYSATTGAGQRCGFSDYVSSTDTATCSTALVTDPTGTVRYEVYGTLSASSGGSAPTAAENADAVWDELLAGHVVSGSAGERLGRIPNVAAGGNGGLPTVNGSNYIAGIQGTLNTLDGLDTAQDTQHSTTQGRLPAALVSGRMDASVGAMAANVLTNTAIQNDAITDSKVASDVTIASVTGSVGSVSGGVGGSVAGSVGSVGTGGITANSIATNAFTADKFSSDVATEITAGIPNSIRDLVIEDQGGGVTLQCAIAVVLAYAAGDLATSAGTSTYEDPSGNETRITGSVSTPGNRAATITCPTN